jgi:dihydroorotate dehydrogenase electron transfer subunit
MLTLDAPPRFPTPSGGTFLMLSVGAEPHILLRRPMAFYDVRKSGARTEVDVLYSVIGRGTVQLSTLKPGVQLSLLGPIGNSFSKPRKGERVAVVAGGIGIAPFLLWGKSLSAATRKDVRILFGFRNRNQLPVVRDFERAKLQIHKAIEGPGGDIRGTVIDLFERELRTNPFDRILTCGPEKMMDRMIEIARREGIPCEVSLEVKMGCGVGACLSCVTHVGARTSPDDYSLVCQDGPIFTLSP